jgi:hypothetical protein
MDSMTAALLKQMKELNLKVKKEVIVSAAQVRNEFNA